MDTTGVSLTSRKNIISTAQLTTYIAKRIVLHWVETYSVPDFIHNKIVHVDADHRDMDKWNHKMARTD